MARFVCSAPPLTPPAEVLAELANAARVLDELAHRDVELAIVNEEHHRTLAVELREAGTCTLLSPRELLDLLAQS